ncbi:MAG: hypothetical protein Q8K92_06085 [Leadbetterella sp.]|nr:hypothetical protein [Leadbetterella sp.]
MANIAKTVIKPKEPKQFRAVFIFTGQGDSTVLAIPTGNGVDDYTYLLLDCDLDREKNEVNIPLMLNDLLETKELPIYLNTHPHKDHTGGIKEVYDSIGIQEVWHSNHRAGGRNKVSDEELDYVLKKVGKSNEFHLKGSDKLNKLRTHDEEEIIKKLGLIDFQVFSPAEYVCNDIDEETEDVKRARIHEQCAVIKFTYLEKSILFTGDANKKAWSDFITRHHKDNLKSDILTASHHCARTAFKENKDDENPFTDHLKYIDAEYLVISAPKQKDSQHGHPNDDALEIYEDFFEKDKIFHLGQEPNGNDPFCLIVTCIILPKCTIESHESVPLNG